MTEYLNNNNNTFCKTERIDINDIVSYLPNILNIIRSISIEKIYNKNVNEEDKEKYIKLLPSNILPKKPYIMDYDAFDNDKFYIYILSIFHNTLYNYNKINLKKIVLKNIIDLVNIFDIIIKNNSNFYTDKDFKFYLYHVINAFQSGSNKIENNSCFFKFGIGILLKKYNINNFNEFFPEKEGQKFIIDFINFLKDIVKKISEEYTNMTIKNSSDDYSKELDEISLIKNELNKENNLYFDNKFIARINNHIDKIVLLKTHISSINYYKYLFYLLIRLQLYLPNDINELFYINYIELKTDISHYINEANDIIFNEVISSNFYGDDIIQRLMKYIIKFNKYQKIKTFLNDENSPNSIKHIFQEIIKEKKFQQKVINFYKSDKIKKFISIHVDKDENEKIMTYLNTFISLLEEDKFWDKIFFYPLSKYKKAYVTNFVRIIINDNYIFFNTFNLTEKYSLLRFILFELIVHELMHLLRRLTLGGVCSELTLTPPNEDDNKKDKLSGEIGERLIKFFFKMNKIQRVILEQAEFFENLTLENEKEIDQLEKIFDIESHKKEKDTTYAKFCKNKKEREIIFEMSDCRDFVYISKFQCI